MHIMLFWNIIIVVRFCVYFFMMGIFIPTYMYIARAINSFKGQSPLVFENKVVYLAMDWRNNPKEKDSVVVTPKETMVRV